MAKRIKLDFRMIIPPLLTIVILLIVYIVKGVYPFGNSNIAYYDMNQGYVPGYSRLYEIFHGSESAIFDWLEGCGMDMTNTYPGYVLHPLNWVFYFLKPDYVLNFLALHLGIKLVLISLSISYYIKKNFELPLLLHITLSMIYTFSGYILQYYTNIFWLETVALFPIIVLALRDMHKNGRCTLFFLLLTFQLITCQYLGFMVLLFVLFYSFGLYFTEKEKEKRRMFSARVGISTFLALASSAVVLLPAVLKWTNLSRTSDSNFDIGKIYGFSISNFQHQKLFMLFNTEFAVAVLVMLIGSVIIKKKRLSRKSVFYLYSFLIMLMPVLNEGINILWHMGSYMHFPFRCGFMLTFSGIELVSSQWSNVEPLTSKCTNPKNNKLGINILTIVIGAVSFVLSVKLYLSFLDYGIHGRAVTYNELPAILVLNIVFYLLILFLYDTKTREAVICIISMLNIAIAAIGFIAPFKYDKNGDFEYYVTRDDFIHDSVSLRNNAGLENDNLSRIKMLYPCLSRNYSAILGIPSISQYMTEAVDSYLDEMAQMGYDWNYTCNFDSGGTLFSDAILNNKKVIAYGDVYVPEIAYTKNAEVDDYSVYDMNFTLPFGMLVDERLFDTDCDKNATAADHQLQLADAFEKEEMHIFSIVDSSEAKLISADKESREYVFHYKLNISSPSLLYICTKSSYKVSVNGREVDFPYFDEINNRNNRRSVKSTLNLISGLDKGEEADIDITLPSDKIDGLQVILLDLDVMANLSEKYENSSVTFYKTGNNKLDMIAEVNEDNCLFLPLEYLDGWHVKVNGSDAQILPVMNGAFMAIKLPAGHCEINMSFMPPTIVKGALITFIGIAISAVILIMKKRGNDVAEIPWISKTASVAFCFVAVTAIVVMYILPVFI